MIKRNLRFNLIPGWCYLFKKNGLYKKEVGIRTQDSNTRGWDSNWVRNIIPEPQIRPDPFVGSIKSATSIINYNSNYTKYIELNFENTHLSTLNRYSDLKVVLLVYLMLVNSYIPNAPFLGGGLGWRRRNFFVLVVIDSHDLRRRTYFLGENYNIV